MCYYFNRIKGDKKMKFLYEKIYSNEYFALILFATIAILLILFGIVLLAAIRDTKKRKLAELEKQEKENINALQDKVNIMSNDEEIFGSTEAFKEESKEAPLEFFKNEDEESKTRDIVLTTPTTKNSMNNLLSEFDDDSDKDISNSEEVIENNQDLNTVFEHHDIIVPSTKVPIKETSPIIEEQPIIQNDNASTLDIVSKVEVPKPITTNYNEIETVIPKVEIPVQEIKDESPTPSIIEDNEDEFELPAIKNVNLEKTVSANNINTSGIDFGKTGILNFSNIENETYEIK